MISITPVLRLLTFLSFSLVGIGAFGIALPTRSSSLSLHQHSTTKLRASNNNNKLTLFSPCKINLFLRIIQKRPDGFHDLASLFQAVGFGDTLELTPLFDENQDTFECNMAGVPTDKSNLVLRALELVREKTGISLYFKANLIKQVPAQAGLGGGSANAATAMWGANELMGNPASLQQLVEWSGELGSDITFFLSKGTAYCQGRGEIMTAINPPLSAGTPVCLVKPNVGLSTPTVFSALDYEKLSTKNPDNLLKAFIKKGVNGVDDDAYLNDLEPPAFDCVPLLASLKQELQQVEGFDHVLMSGSGTTIFCLGEPKNKEAFLEKFGQRDDLQVFFSQFINRKDGEWFERPSNVIGSESSELTM